jgi:hypothetical protein
MKKRYLPRISLKMREHFLSNIIIVTAVVFVWRGLWNLMDIYVFPENPAISNIVSILIGLLLLYLPDDDIKELGEALSK